MPFFLSKNDDIHVTCSKLGPHGDGIAYHQDHKIFIPEFIPGEAGLAHILKLQRYHAFAKLTYLSSYSEKRRKSPCPIASRCGGCTLQHISYEHQISLKQIYLEEQFHAYHVYPIIPCPDEFSCRNKAQFAIQKDPKTNLISVGLYAKHSHRVIDTEECLILYPELNSLLSQFRSFLKITKESVYDEKTQTGFLRHLVLRYSPENQEAMIALVATDAFFSEKDIFCHFFNTLPFVRSILLNVNQDPGDTVLGKNNILLYGKDHILDKIGSLQFFCQLNTFMQVNPQQRLTLYKVIQKHILPGHTLWDLYCGVGSIALFLHAQFDHVIGIESDEHSIELARKNASLNGISHANFFHSKSEDAELNIGQNDSVVLDPPRKGCHPSLLKKLCELKPKCIIYVSCNPVSCLRDLEILKNEYQVHFLQPIDLFTQTMHIESVLLLTPRHDL